MEKIVNQSASALVLYHANCADGFCAAWVCRLAMPDCECVPVMYGQEPPDVKDREVFIVDFSYPRNVLERMNGEAESLIVFDHHKTAQADLDGLPYCCFDMNKSGGRLAWDYFFPGKKSPWLVDYTEDRDLWRWVLSDSRAISAFIASYPHNFVLWDEWGQTSTDSFAWDGYVDAGSAILRYQQQQVESAVRNAAEIDLAGYKVLAVNTTTLTSEIAGKLAENRPFGAAYFVRADGRKVWSLRSRDGGIDVSQIAKSKGGGGHRNAAGFTE